MQSFCKNFHGVGIMISGNLGSFALRSKLPFHGKGTITDFLQQTTSYSKGSSFLLLLKCFSCAPLASGHGLGMQTDSLISCNSIPPILSFYKNLWQGSFRSGTVGLGFPVRCITTMDESKKSLVEDGSSTIPDVAPRVKFKRPDKTAKHIMQILDKEAVEQVRTARDIPDIRPGYIIQLKVEVPQNKRRVSLLKGIVIARRNAGLNTTFRLRRLVAGVGVESVYPLYSPNIKEIKVLDKHEVRRAKLYYLRDRMNPLKK